MRAPPLARGEVHVWRLALDGEPAPAELAMLATEEAARSARFAFARERRRFARAHASMRRILGLYAGLAPERVPLTADAHGKPRIEGIGLGFNLSHSGERALLAVSRATHVGVDVEEASARVDARLVAAEVFSPEECRALDGLEGEALHAAFLAGWVRKEAVLKAIGVGLAVAPRLFHAGLGPGRARVACAGLAPHPFVEVVSLAPEGARHAAVAVVGGFDALRILDEASAGARAVLGHNPDRHPEPNPAAR